MYGQEAESEMREWTKRFDFDLNFISLEDLDVSSELADVLNNSENLLFLFLFHLKFKNS